MPPRARRAAAAPDGAAPWTRSGGRLVRRPVSGGALADAGVEQWLLPLVLALLPPVEIVRAQLVCWRWRLAARARDVWANADLTLRSSLAPRLSTVRGCFWR
jgi:hypothetical protein